MRTKSDTNIEHPNCFEEQQVEDDCTNTMVLKLGPYDLVVVMGETSGKRSHDKCVRGL